MEPTRSQIEVPTPEEQEAVVDQYAAELSLEPRWTYLRALAWIGLRDANEMAKLLLHHSSFHIVVGGPGTNVMALSLKIEAWPGVIHRRPLAGLLTALRADRVTAWGKLNGDAPSIIIEPEQWDCLDFTDIRSGFDDDYVTDWKPGGGWYTVWSDVRFDRASVMRAFPPAPPHNTRPSPELDRLRAALVTEYQRVGVLSQVDAERIGRAHFSGSRSIARAMTKEITGNDKPGRIPGSTKARLKSRQ